MSSSVDAPEVSRTEGANGVLSNGTSLSIRDHESVIPDTKAQNIALPDKVVSSVEPASATNLTEDSTISAPIQHVAPGLAPVADFIPKDQPASHPTPPPDDISPIAQPAVTAPATDAIDAPKPVSPSIATPVESSLIRPRDEDDEPEPAAKRTKVDAEVNGDVTMPDAPASEAAAPAATESAPAAAAPSEATQAQPAEVAQPEVESKSDAITPSISEIKPESTTELGSEMQVDTAPQAGSEPQADAAVPPESGVKVESASEIESNVQTEAPAQPSTDASATSEAQPTAAAEPTSDVLPTTEVAPTTNGDAASSEAKPATDASQPAAAPAVPEKYEYSKEPMTPAQKTVLVEKMKNLKKTRNSTAFLKPVDYIALNIPHYPDVIKNPMDLSTMEQKLKSGQYGSVQDFADDFELIISNTKKFNGEQHAVTHAGNAMEAYFRNMMRSIPSPNEPIPQKAKPAPAFSKPPAPRREPRAVNVPPTPPAASASNTNTFALQPDGTPLIRRDSNINRPSRPIKPPQSREISYGQPKRKEAQPELRFCEHVLNQIKGTRFSPQNNPFLMPVDPVALNIPHYHQIIKNPMDLSTMQNKMKHGEYARAADFKKDFDLIISNCNLFNPVGNAVRQLGEQLKKDFEGLWAGKEKFVQKRKAEMQRQQEQSEEEESGEEEEEEEDPAELSQLDTIRALQKQLSDMQNALAGLGQVNKKTKKSKSSSKSSSKKTGTSSSSTKLKTKPKAPKKPRQVTYEEKQEISSAVENLNEAQLQGLTTIITENCAKYRDMDEMELEIDDLPNNVQLLLLDFVRSIFGNPNRGASARRGSSPDDIAAMDDDDFEPDSRGRRASGGPKRKKHKPMGKKEQQDTIAHIQSQLAQFSNPGGAVGGGAGGYQDQSAIDASSEDDDSEESEEE